MVWVAGQLDACLLRDAVQRAGDEGVRAERVFVFKVLRDQRDASQRGVGGDAEFSFAAFGELVV
jgi:hypothetical protein